MMSHLAILCVDDESFVTDALTEQLKRHFGPKYLYETAHSADEAWEVIEDFVAQEVRILVIVSDWLMPGMKGDEFLIQVHQQFPAITKVLLTGQADQSAIQRAQQQANLHRCIQKPWKEAELIDAILSGLK